jgi:hypothetical protein
VRRVEGGALLIEGHVPRSGAITAARAYLLAEGMDEWDVDERLVDRPGLVGRAYWGGDEVGFVGEEYPGAEPVTVVTVA